MSLPSSFPMKVANGKTVDVPSVGFGTWASGETGWCKDATLAALKAGYRHLDCAWKYGVDEAVGDAIRESRIPRSEIFITTKFWPNFAHPSNVPKCLDLVLKNMGLDYVDLYLTHWPVATVAGSNIVNARAGPDATPEDQAIVTDEKTGKDKLDLEHSPRDVAERLGVEGSFLPTWHAMQALVETGKCRAIGVSNFSIAQLDEILSSYSSSSSSSKPTTSSSAGRDSHSPSTTIATNPTIPLSCNQIESHPYLPNTALLKFMSTHSILATAYSPFAGQASTPSPWVTSSSTEHEPPPLLLSHPILDRLSRTLSLDVGQILQSWAVQRGTIPLGKSQDPGRIRMNLDVQRLEDKVVRELDGLEVPGERGRTIDYGGFWGVKFFV